RSFVAATPAVKSTTASSRPDVESWQLSERNVKQDISGLRRVGFGLAAGAVKFRLGEVGRGAPGAEGGRPAGGPLCRFIETWSSSVPGAQSILRVRRRRLPRGAVRLVNQVSL